MLPMYPILFARRQHVAVRDVYCGSDAAPGSQYCNNLLLLQGDSAGAWPSAVTL